MILTPSSAVSRAPAALSAASGRSPRTLGGVSRQTLAPAGVRSAMSPTGETPPGRRQGGKSKRLRSSDSAPLPARNQADIFSLTSLFPARTPRQQGAPAVCRTRLLRSCCVSQHAAAHHCTSHTIAHRTPLYTAHHCTPHTIAHRTPLYTTLLHITHHCTSHTTAHCTHTIVHCALYSYPRALYSYPRALCSYTRALYSYPRALYSYTRALYSYLLDRP
jgi:hypothetical protein